MRIAFRVDASLQIGSGHVMRCLTLATQIKSIGADVFFICRELPGNMLDYIKKQNFVVHGLPGSKTISGTGNNQDSHSDWLQVPKLRDAEETAKVLASYGQIDWIVVDHYAIDSEWENHLRSYARKIAVIDDLADRLHNCDLMLDQNFYVDSESRYQSLVPKQCKTLLGPLYCLLRPEFSLVRQRIARTYDSVKRILVFFGGVDLHNATLKTLRALDVLGLENIAIDVVIGQSNPNRIEIESLCQKIRHATLHVQISNMADMMASADLCIGGGGTATWERCCLGLPALAWPIAENQRKLLADCALNGFVYLPDFDDPDENDIANHIASLIQNSSLRYNLGVAGMRLIDGNGALRVAKMLMRPTVHIRPATLDDMRMTYEWRNHPSVRAVSRNTSFIDWDQHKNWYEGVLKDSSRILFIAMADNHPVGVLRFDINKDEAEVSLYLAPDRHGHGYGIAMIESGESWLGNNRPEVRNVMAEVMHDNLASRKLFDSCGYAVSSTKYRKRIN